MGSRAAFPHALFASLLLAPSALAQLGSTGPDQTLSIPISNSSFGFAVSAAGDVNGDGHPDLIVGAPDFDGDLFEQGRAFVYLGSPSGLASTPAWFFDGGQSGAHFGWAVSLAGDVNGDGYGDVLVGAPHFDGTFADEGKAWLFLGSETGLSTTPDWTASGDQADAWFGDELHVAGDVNGDGFSDVIVGALLRDDATSNEGATYVFHGSLAGLSPTPDQTMLGTQAGENHGYAVATAGDVNSDGYDDVIVGAPFWNSASYVNVGRAHVYFGSPTGVPATPSFTATGTGFVDDEEFGAAVAGVGDTDADGYDDVAIGAPGGPDFFGGVLGLVTVYHGTAGLPNDPDLKFGPGPTAGYGRAVMAAGDVDADGFADFAIGAPTANAGGSNRGTITLESGNDFLTQQLLSYSSTSNGDLLGSTISLIGDVDGDGYSEWAAGAPGADEVLVFRGSGRAFQNTTFFSTSAAKFTVGGGQTDARLGRSVACAGDVDGDGYDDLLVGVHAFDVALGDEGSVWLFRGPTLDVLPVPDWRIDGTQAAGNLGVAVSAAGDVDGDGYADVLVGETGFDGAFVDEGRMLLFLGGANGLRSTPAWERRGGATGVAFGDLFASAGDVNGDGFGDVLVGLPNDDSGAVDGGRIELYFGAPSGLADAPDWAYSGTSAGAKLGRAIASAGDVNGDGFADVLAGAPRYANGEPLEGFAALWLGGPTGPRALPDWTAESDETGARFGRAVASARDVDGDGYGDVVIGAPDAGSFQGGAAFLVRGSAQGLGALERFQSAYSSGDFGQTVDAIDVNGDGFSDLVVGNPTSDRVWVRYGSAAGVVPGATYETNLGDPVTGSNAYGTSLATGDLNGDGFGDIVVGDPQFTRTLPNYVAEGKVSVSFGNSGGDSLVRNAHAVDAATGGPLPRGGLSVSPDAIVVRELLPPLRSVPLWATGASPSVRLEVELKPLDVPFDGQGTVFSASLPVDVTNATPFDVTVPRTGPQRGAYHWRTRFVFTGIPMLGASPWRQPGAVSPSEATVRFTTRIRVVPPLR